jgi:predicted alpha-1,2-mannosidase
MPGFAPDFHTNSGVGAFYEGTPWHYSCYVPHDIAGLIQRHGGTQNFTAFLDQLFDTGQYNPGNEPDLLTPWLYSYVGRPDKNADRVQKILATNYGISRSGLPGNDDAGAMSSWYVFGAMGFFPNAGQDLYLISAPIFSQASINVGSGKTFKIVADNVSETNKYVQSAQLNGKALQRAWLRHAEITAGGELKFVMGPEPGKWGRGEPPPAAPAALAKL